MSLLLSTFCIVTWAKQWRHKRSRLLSESPTEEIICIYFLCVQRRCNTPMFRDFTGTVRYGDNCPHSVQFDTDSYWIGIGIFASGWMSPDRDNFITYKASEGKQCKGIVAGLKIEGRGTLKFRIYDNDGIAHTITVPNSVHILDLLMVLVSPQYWAQQTSDGNKSTSDDKNTIPTLWGYMKTIP